MQMDISLAHETFSDNSTATMFPINQLRNYARLQVKVWNRLG